MQRLALIVSCAQDAWRPHLGDPSFGGLALTVLYIVASLFFLRTLWVTDGWLPRERLLWGVCTVLVVLITLNKQLDLQQTIIWTGRCVARHEGWFDQRLVFQRHFGMSVMALLAAGGLALAWACRRVLAANWRLILGMVLLMVFVALQVARFEQLAGDVGQTILHYKLHRILEGIALCVLIWSASTRPRPAI